VCIFLFLRLSVFLALVQVLKFAFLIFHVFQVFVFCNILGRTVCISHFRRISFFLPCSRSYSVCVSPRVFQFSCHILGPTVCISHFPHFSLFLAIFHVLKCALFIFHVSQFSRHNQVLKCAVPIFHVFQVSLNIPGPTVSIFHFPRFSVFLNIFQVL
jgi:hypothetical protein